jgi:type I restriction enzyme S subunit
MAELLQENDRLISLRDTLIPKLMSGELKINDLNC